MLEGLPAEVLEQVVGYLPGATSIIALCLTSKSLYAAISANDYAFFRLFVQKSFPSVLLPTDQNWRDLACALTSRSRAWDKIGLVGQECYAPRHLTTHPRVDRISRYISTIDTYGDYSRPNNLSGVEVLAIGAAGRVFIRRQDSKSSKWSAYMSQGDHLPRTDVLDVRLLRPHQRSDAHGESVVVRRIDNTLVRIDFSRDLSRSYSALSYVLPPSGIDCIDVSPTQTALLATCTAQSLNIYPVYGSDSVTKLRPSASAQLSETTIVAELHSRGRCCRFLSDTRLVTSIEHLEGNKRSPLVIYDINQSNIIAEEVHTSAMPASKSYRDLPERCCAASLAKLDPTASLAGHGGDVFLSGWIDGSVRLHDLRLSDNSVLAYSDSVDHGPILSLLALGHEKIVAGSGTNACLKIYDMRMPGTNAYSYLDVRNTVSQPNTHPDNYRPETAWKVIEKKPRQPPSSLSKLSRNLQRDITIFLSVQMGRQHGVWSKLPLQQPIGDLHATNHQTSSQQGRQQYRDAGFRQGSRGARNGQRTSTFDTAQRYNGSIYSLSSPSSISSKVFAGISGHVLELDFRCTDDILREEKMTSSGLSYPAKSNGSKTPQFNISCYERPREERIMTDEVRLRTQVGFQSDIVQRWSAFSEQNIDDGWDIRLPPPANVKRVGR